MAWDKSSPAAGETPAVSQPVILANWAALEAALGSGTLAATNTIAQGDVLTGTAANTLTNLATGTAGQVLVSGGAAADLSWTTKGKIVQVVNVQDGAVATGTTALPYDDTIPQITEGDEYMTLAITPTSTTNKLKIDVVAHTEHTALYQMCVALFQDTTAGALACGFMGMVASSEADQSRPICFTHYMDAGTTSATTFRVRIGSNTGSTTTFNGVAGARKYGGVLASSITITEISVT